MPHPDAAALLSDWTGAHGGKAPFDGAGGPWDAAVARPLWSLLAGGLLAGCAAFSSPGPSAPAGLHVDCRGAASAAPTVILESGAFGTSADWGAVIDDLAKGGRVCAYDRAGVGGSPPRGGSEDALAIARELDGLLGQIGERRPVILVGHSNGALYAEAFAALYPRKVAGLVYIQGVTSDDLDHPELIDDLKLERNLSNMAGVIGDMGLAPLVAQVLTDNAGLGDGSARRKEAALSSAAKLRAARNEDRAIIDSLTAVRRAGGAPASIPVAVLTGSTEPGSRLYKAWRAAETAAAARARASWVLDMPGATHTSPLSRDRAYVAAAVAWLRGLN